MMSEHEPTTNLAETVKQQKADCHRGGDRRWRRLSNPQPPPPRYRGPDAPPPARDAHVNLIWSHWSEAEKIRVITRGFDAAIFRSRASGLVSVTPCASLRGRDVHGVMVKLVDRAELIEAINRLSLEYASLDQHLGVIAKERVPHEVLGAAADALVETLPWITAVVSADRAAKEGYQLGIYYVHGPILVVPIGWTFGRDCGADAVFEPGRV
jgi:hypothetical protein